MALLDELKKYFSLKDETLSKEEIIQIASNAAASGKPLKITDPTPTVDGVYLPVTVGVYPNGLEKKEGYDTRFILSGGVWTVIEDKMPPAENKIKDWTAGEYFEGEQRNHLGQIWVVRQGVSSTTKEPGTETGDPIAWDWVPKIYTDLPFNSGRNKFDKDKAIIGYYISPTGGGMIPTAEGIAVSDFIPVDGDALYIQSHFQRPLAFYAADKSFISGIVNPESYITPSSARFVRLSIPVEFIDAFMMVEGGQLPEKYLPYGLAMESLLLNDSNFAQTDVESLAGFVSGENLFNKETAIVGRYVSYTTGELVTNINYSASAYIPVEPDTQYRQNQNQQLAFFDSNLDYLSGLATPAGAAYTTPSAARYVRVTVPNIDTFMLVKGTELPESYVPYDIKYKENLRVRSWQVIRDENTRVVSPSGAIQTINDALDSITDANENKRHTVIVEDGTYEETITTKPYVDIVARNSRKAIIDFNRPLDEYFNDYSTIFAHSTSLLKGLHVRCGNSKYPIHSDWGNSNFPYDLKIQDCLLEHYGPDMQAGSAVGIGLYQNQHITIEDTDIIANVTESTGGSGIHIHDIDDSAGTGFRSLTVRRVRMLRVQNGFQIYSVSSGSAQQNSVTIEDVAINARFSDIMMNHNGYYNWDIKISGTPIQRVQKLKSSGLPIIEAVGFTRRMENKIGITILKGSVVVIENGWLGYTRTTTIPGHRHVLGIAMEDIAPQDTGVVQISGWAELRVNGTDPIALGDDLQTSSEHGVAIKGTSNPFAVAMSGYNVADSNGIIQALIRG